MKHFLVGYRKLKVPAPGKIRLTLEVVLEKVAVNMHNGCPAWFLHENGRWTILCINCPSGKMLEDLGTWLKGEVR